MLRIEFSDPEFLSALETLDLRQRILRPGQPASLCTYSEDSEATTFHLGIRQQSFIVSNGTFILQPHELFQSAKKAYRLRGMATDNDFQRQGLGRMILQAGLIELKKRNSDLLWFNARTSAELFYVRQGFLSLEKAFDIARIGPHKIMYKWL